MVYSTGTDLYLAKGDGTEARKLAALNGLAFWPRWSPDGARIRFSLNPKTDLNANTLWEMGADGNRLHQLLPGWTNPSADCCGSWTADGRYFVFQSMHGGIANVWAIRESGTLFRQVNHEPVQLTSGPTNTYSPTLDPAGKRVFVQTIQPRGELVRWDAQLRQYLPFLSGIQASALDFSKDGKWVTYVTFPNGYLWRSRVDGS